MYSKLRNHLLAQIYVNKRLQDAVLCYLLFLMISVRKHSIRDAAVFSRSHPSRYTRLLKEHRGLAVHNLRELGAKRARRYAKLAEKLSEGKLPWSAAVIIDATIQHRSSLHAENVKRFNHGSGFEIGHQWTNIVILIAGNLIPLPPIAFQSKAYCAKHGLTYQSEHVWVADYVRNLDLEYYIGPHDPESVIFLADSGYDDKKIENAIRSRGWHFLIALKVTRSVRSLKEHRSSPKSKLWHQVADLFKRHRCVPWQSIRITTKQRKNKRMDLRIRQISAHLKSVCRVQLVCSEMKRRPDGRRKYLACSDMRVTGRQIVLAYRLRWAIEIFHKEVKMFLGFEDVAAHSFESVCSHVHWVYCTYLLIRDNVKGAMDGLDSLAERQARVTDIVHSAEKSRAVQILTQFNGPQRYKSHLQEVIRNIESGIALKHVPLSP